MDFKSGALFFNYRLGCERSGVSLYCLIVGQVVCIRIFSKGQFFLIDFLCVFDIKF